MTNPAETQSAANLNGLVQYQDEMYVVTKNDGLVTILTALDLIITQDESQRDDPAYTYLDPNNSYAIVAEDVTIVGNITLPGKSLLLYARDITLVPIQVNGGTICTTAASPPDPVAQLPAAAAPSGALSTPGTGGKAGVDGKAGAAASNSGDVDIRARFIYLGTATEGGELFESLGLTIVTDGAPGGAGQDGQDGQPGGEGGAGHSPYQYDPARGKTGGSGGAGGKGGDGGAGGAAGRINVQFIEYTYAPPSSRMASMGPTTSAVGGAGGEGGAGGKGGAGGPGGPGFHAPMVNRTGPQGYSGASGSDGTPGSNGATGANGSVAVTLMYQDYTQADLCGCYDDCGDFLPSIADKFLMSLQRAKLAYLQASISTGGDWNSVADRFAYLCAITSSVKPTQTDDNIAAAVSTFNNIYNQAAVFDARRKGGLDYFGHPPGYVPLVSYSAYKSDLGGADGSGGQLATFKVIEDNFNSYFAAEQAVQNKIDAITAAQKQISAEVAGQQNKQTVLLADAAAVVQQLPAAEAACQQTEQSAVDQLQEVFDSIQAKLMFKTAKDFVSGLGTMIFDAANAYKDKSPQEAVKAVQAGIGLISQTISDVKVGTDFAVQSQYLIQSFQAVDGDSPTFSTDVYQAYQQMQQSQAAETSKMLVFVGDLDSLLNKYGLAADEKQQVDNAVGAYAAAVNAKNGLLMRYYSDCLQIAQAENRIEQLGSQSGTLGATLLAQSNPSQPAFVAAMSQFYHIVRERLLSEVNDFYRAYAYWALDTSAAPPFAGLLPYGINYNMLESAYSDISQNYTNVLETFLASPSVTPALVPANTDCLDVPSGAPALGVAYHIDNSQGLLDAFRQVQTVGQTQLHVMYFRVALDGGAPAGSPEVPPPFQNRYDVRLLLARPWLVGVDPGSNGISLELTQMGAETIYDLSAGHAPHDFTHEPKPLFFQYQSGTDNQFHIQTDAKLGNVSANDAATNDYQEYAPIGPFAVWKLAMEADAAIDLSSLKEVVIDFWVQFQESLTVAETRSSTSA